MSAVTTFAFNRTHSVTFVADAMRSALVRLIQGLGLRPESLLSSWPTLGAAIETKLQSGNLTQITVEFYVPGASAACARWDIPVSYDGSGVADDMWLDRDHLARTLAKAPRPPSNAIYRILLSSRDGWQGVPGIEPTAFMSTGSLVSRSTGTIIASADITAGLSYWRASA